MNIIQNPREKVMIALVSKDDYIRNTECLFSDKTKFQVLYKDPTLQSLHRTKLFKYIIQSWGISNDKKKSMCPKFAKIEHMGYQKLIKNFKIYLHSDP